MPDAVTCKGLQWTFKRAILAAIRRDIRFSIHLVDPVRQSLANHRCTEAVLPHYPAAWMSSRSRRDGGLIGWYGSEPVNLM